MSEMVVLDRGSSGAQLPVVALSQVVRITTWRGDTHKVDRGSFTIADGAARWTRKDRIYFCKAASIELLECRP